MLFAQLWWQSRSVALPRRPPRVHKTNKPSSSSSSSSSALQVINTSLRTKRRRVNQVQAEIYKLFGRGSRCQIGQEAELLQEKDLLLTPKCFSARAHVSLFCLKRSDRFPRRLFVSSSWFPPLLYLSPMAAPLTSVLTCSDLTSVSCDAPDHVTSASQTVDSSPR